MKCKKVDLKKAYHQEYKVLKNRIIKLIRESKENFPSYLFFTKRQKLKINLERYKRSY